MWEAAWCRGAGGCRLVGGEGQGCRRPRMGWQHELPLSQCDVAEWPDAGPSSQGVQPATWGLTGDRRPVHTRGLVTRADATSGHRLVFPTHGACTHVAILGLCSCPFTHMGPRHSQPRHKGLILQQEL